MAIIYGLDGSRAGWVAVSQDTDSRSLDWRRLQRAGDLLEAKPRPAVIAIDIPIGLPDEGARACDVEARKRLGARRNSVFPPPIRPLLTAATHGDASEIRTRVEGKRLSAQSWSIVPRILEVDELLRQDPRRQSIIREIHPELSFCVMNNGVPMPHAKKSAEGRAERLQLLHTHFGDAPDRALADRRKLRCADDDILDAFAALWTAGRVQRGEAGWVPDSPSTDAAGLRMEIVF